MMKKVDDLSVLTDAELENYIRECNKEFERLVRLSAGRKEALYIKLVHGQHAECVRTAKEKMRRMSNARSPTI